MGVKGAPRESARGTQPLFPHRVAARSVRAGGGVGRALLAHLRAATKRTTLVGTRAAADWAIGFYRPDRFELVSPERRTELLKTSDRQIETSVVLSSRP